MTRKPTTASDEAMPERSAGGEMTSDAHREARIVLEDPKRFEPLNQKGDRQRGVRAERLRSVGRTAATVVVPALLAFGGMQLLTSHFDLPGDRAAASIEKEAMPAVPSEIPLADRAEATMNAGSAAMPDTRGPDSDSAGYEWIVEDHVRPISPDHHDHAEIERSSPPDRPRSQWMQSQLVSAVHTAPLGPTRVEAVQSGGNLQPIHLASDQAEFGLLPRTPISHTQTPEASADHQLHSHASTSDPIAQEHRVGSPAATVAVVAMTTSLSNLDAGAYSSDRDPILEGENDNLICKTKIPLTNGRIEFGILFGEMLDALGFPSQSTQNVREALGNADINVTGFVGQGQLRLLESVTGRVLTFEADQTALTLKVDLLRLREQRAAIHDAISDTLSSWFPATTEAMASRYGMYLHTTPDVMRALDHEQDPAAVNLLSNLVAKQGGNGSPDGRRTVVLVHGLDDPGIIWNELIPELLGAGHTVLRFEYPNDQPIAESASLFAEELESLRTAGVDNLSIVAHSMGSLVTREVLTNPVWYAGQASWGGAAERLPTVDRFIMVGPPNHGSSLANLRFAAEWRDVAVRTFTNAEDGFLFNGFFDGAGEAKIDLLPDSEFLRQLNARPLPDGVDMTIIAGRMSPVADDEIGNLLRHLRQEHAEHERKQGGRSGSSAEGGGAAGTMTDGQRNHGNTDRGRIAPFGLDVEVDPDAWNESVDNLESGLRAVVSGVGDGAVSLVSTRLEGVTDQVIVEANHFGMLRNVIPGSDRVPPAIPVILDRLSRPTN
ncbi:MAG: esterase/lipase family protein [Planctomycetota bacterium]